MSEVKQWCVLISAVSIISGVILSVIPSGKLKNVYNCLVSVLLIYAFLLPVINKEKYDFDFGTYLKQNEEVSREFSQRVYIPAESVINSEIERSIEHKLKENGYEADCYVKSTVTENEFSVDNISICLPDDFKDKRVVESLIEDYKTPLTKIEFIGDKNE